VGGFSQKLAGNQGGQQEIFFNQLHLKYIFCCVGQIRGIIHFMGFGMMGLIWKFGAVVVVVVVVDVALKWKIRIMLAFAPSFLGKLFFFACTTYMGRKGRGWGW
jgi:hypothetical protein